MYFCIYTNICSYFPMMWICYLFKGKKKKEEEETNLLKISQDTCQFNETHSRKNHNGGKNLTLSNRKPGRAGWLCLKQRWWLEYPAIPLPIYSLNTHWHIPGRTQGSNNMFITIHYTNQRRVPLEVRGYIFISEFPAQRSSAL